MIYLYSGTPRSGKSLHAAKTIYTRLKRKDPCICNFEINTDKIGKNIGQFLYKQNCEITPDFLKEFSKNYFNGGHVKEDKILLVLDECQLMFNAREWNAKGRENWLSFFTQHGKYGYTVLLIAQFDRMIDRQIRSLIEYEYIHRKASNMGWRGWLISFWALGKLFVSVKVWYPMKEKVGQDFFTLRKKYACIYDTHDLFGTDSEGGSGDPAASVPDTACITDIPLVTDSGNGSVPT